MGQIKCICGFPLTFHKYIVEEDKVVADVYVCNRCKRELHIITGDENEL
jgi:hypothetical protein